MGPAPRFGRNRAGRWPMAQDDLLEAATVWKQLPCSSALFGQG